MKYSIFVATLLILTATARTFAQTPNPAGQSGPGSFLEVENGKIYYEECGSGPQTVVLVHDGVLDSSVSSDDRRGYGRSPAATEGYFATDDLAALLRHLKVSHAAIVGSSHGGEIRCRQEAHDRFAADKSSRSDASGI